MSTKIKVRNPRTGEYDYEFAPPTVEQLRECARQLRLSSKQWAAAGLAYRLEAMQRWKQELACRRAEIVASLAVDTGRYLISSIEVDGLLRTIDRWCETAPSLLQEQEQQSVSLPTVRYRTQFVPYELVGVISPWNFPVTLSFIDTIPALIAGCSVIVKPSEIAPRFAEPLRQTLAAVPEVQQVLALLPGGGETGAALLDVVDAICFTGSVKTGRAVAEVAARRFIPAFLELGGKDPAIITASADLNIAAEAILRASVLATGQACQSLERIYVQEAIFEPFIALLTEKAQRVTLNYPDLHRGHLGPLIFDKQADIIAAQLTDAVNKGARVLCGGEIETHGGGLWLRPTVVVNVNHSLKLMTEETFGPVLPVMAYRTIEDALTLANDTEFGLSAAVFAGSVTEAEAIARRIEAGAVSINDGALTSMMYEAEKSSFKYSGLGNSRMGASGLLRFLRKQALLIQTGLPMSLATMDEVNA